MSKIHERINGAFRLRWETSRIQSVVVRNFAQRKCVVDVPMIRRASCCLISVLHLCMLFWIEPDTFYCISFYHVVSHWSIH